MESLEFCDKHNMVAYLEKSEGSEGFHQIIDFLTSSHIHYALTESPTLYASTIEQFWQTSTLCTTEEGVMAVTATIDRKVNLLVTEASIRRYLKLEDSEGLNTLPTAEIFEQLALIGYVTTSDKEPAPVSHESPLQSIHSLGRDKDCLSLNELTVLCTTLSKKVEDLQNDLKQTKLTYGAAYTKLILRVKILEKQFKTSNARRRVRLVLSEDEDAAEDSSKQGRKISEIDRDPTISLVQEEGMTWFQEDAEIQEKNSTDTEILLDVEEPTELVNDQGSGEKVKKKRSAEKRKDKGKAIMTEPEPEQTTTKLKLIQERAGLEATIRLQEQLNEEESQRIAMDAEIARQLQEEINIAGQEKNRPFSKDEVMKNMCTDEVLEGTAQEYESTAGANLSTARRYCSKVLLLFESTAHYAQSTVVCESTASVIRYLRTYCLLYQISGDEDLQNLGMCEIFLSDHYMEPTEIEIQEMVNIWVSGEAYCLNVFHLHAPLEGRNDHSVIRFYTQQNRPFSKEEDYEIEKEVMKRPGFDLQQDNSKRQKTRERSVSVEEPKDKEQVEPSQEEIQEMKIILPEEGMHVEALQTKYPLIGWEIHSEDTIKYDLVKLWELIKERFNTTEPIDDKEGELWVELKRLFKPDTDELMELQSHMHDPLTWRLYDTCGVHHVSTKTGLDMFMMVEKDYPLTRGLTMLMLVNKLQVDNDSEMANELLRKIFILANKPRQ
ncbi:hypothetical protein Tco_1002224 [Tanacetum coccineum]|uniref:Uncharacterized protein n=1 Tax=Tanacetum coccineum TaxID=301880 RepID=A0ABQ5F5S3_9ASTR